MMFHMKEKDHLTFFFFTGFSTFISLLVQGELCGQIVDSRDELRFTAGKVLQQQGERKHGSFRVSALGFRSKPWSSWSATLHTFLQLLDESTSKKNFCKQQMKVNRLFIYGQSSFTIGELWIHLDGRQQPISCEGNAGRVAPQVSRINVFH